MNVSGWGVGEVLSCCLLFYLFVCPQLFINLAKQAKRGSSRRRSTRVQGLQCGPPSKHRQAAATLLCISVKCIPRLPTDCQQLNANTNCVFYAIGHQLLAISRVFKLMQDPADCQKLTADCPKGAVPAWASRCCVSAVAGSVAEQGGLQEARRAEEDRGRGTGDGGVSGGESERGNGARTDTGGAGEDEASARMKNRGATARTKTSGGRGRSWRRRGRRRGRGRGRGRHGGRGDERGQDAARRKTG